MTRMAKVIITTVITVDGLMEAPALPPEGWLILEGDHEPAEFEMWQNAAGMLVGRKNYEGFAAVWPTMAGDGRWADMLNPHEEVGGLENTQRPAGVERHSH